MKFANRLDAIGIFTISILATGLLLSSSPSNAQRRPEWVRPISVDFHKKSGRTKTNLTAQNVVKDSQKKCSPDCNELRRKVRERGTVSVIVSIHVPDLPDETKIPDAPLNQKLKLQESRRKSIAEAQERLLRRLSKHNVNRVVRLEYTAAVGMVVDPTALDAIIADPEVTAIGENVPLRPSLRQSVPLV